MGLKFVFAPEAGGYEGSNYAYCNATTGGGQGHIFAEYTNNTNESVQLKSITIASGAGIGYFTRGSSVHGTVSSYRMRLTSSAGNSNWVTVSNTVSPTGSPSYPEPSDLVNPVNGNYFPDSAPYCTPLTKSSNKFTFNNLILDANESIDFYLDFEDSPSSSICFCWYQRGAASIIDVGPSSHKVTFNLNGGTRTGGGSLNQDVEDGKYAVAPIAVKTGYIFNGWDKALGPITSDTTITAIWLSQIWRFNGSKWERVRVAKRFNGSTWENVYVHQKDSSNWGNYS